MTSVGIVGTGRMGSAMARALVREGCEVVLHNRTRTRADAIAAELGRSARSAATAAEAARAGEVCISMLADGPAVEATYEGPDGILAGAHRGGVLVDMSTVPPTVIRSLASAARSVGSGILDAPVSGSVGLAEQGQLTIMVGGDAADLERARPVLDLLAKSLFHLGPLGSGAAMKLAVNAVVFGLNGALSEGLVLAEAAGIERSAAYDVLAASAIGAPYVGYKRAAFLDPDGTPTAFALDLAEKDMRLITALASELGVPAPQSELNLAVIRAAVAEGRGSDDFSAVATHLREASAAPGGASAGAGSRRAS
jgi:3-hydroxyisobutyrate dehydrogenase-like beta-hydroxyacid dehydrogenase